MFMFTVQDVVYGATVSPVKYKFVFRMVNASVEFSCQVHTLVSAQLSSAQRGVFMTSKGTLYMKVFPLPSVKLLLWFIN